MTTDKSPHLSGSRSVKRGQATTQPWGPFGFSVLWLLDKTFKSLTFLHGQLYFVGNPTCFNACETWQGCPKEILELCLPVWVNANSFEVELYEIANSEHSQNGNFIWFNLDLFNLMAHKCGEYYCHLTRSCCEFYILGVMKHTFVLA